MLRENIKLFLLLFIFSLSCNNESSNPSTIEASENIFDTTNESKDLYTNVSEEEDGQRMIQERAEHAIRMKQKSFIFQCADNCKSGGVSADMLNKYGTRKPFNIEKTLTDSLLSVRFSFIADCCLEFVGDINRNNDSLKLLYHDISLTPCECYCEYEYKFDINIQNQKYRTILLNGNKI